MTSHKLYLLVGLAFFLAAVTQINSTKGEDFAWAGVLFSVLGLMQPYVSLPKNVKFLSVFALVAAVIAVESGNNVAEMIGGGISFLVLLAHFVGVFRYHDLSHAQ